MHELMNNHPKKLGKFNQSCECGLRFVSGFNLNEDDKLSIIENLAIGNPWYTYLNSIQMRYVAKHLLNIKYPFHLPIHQSLASYIVALNHLHGIKECDAKTLALAFTKQLEVFKGLLIYWDIYKSTIKDDILQTWKIHGDYILEVLSI
jgi:hypothetical protein